MKFLGISGGGHDSNISLYDNGVVTYHKFEREFDEKHKQIDAMTIIMDHAERVFGIPLSEYDAIGSLSKGIAVDFMQQYNHNPFHVDHHTAHSLCGWMVNPNADLQITIDGVGDDVSWAVWKGGNCLEKHFDTQGSIGREMDSIAAQMGILAFHDVDFAGKLMGLQSYGDVDKPFLELIRSASVFDDFSELGKIHVWDKFYKDSVLHKHKKLDWIATLHKRFGEMVMDIFDKYAKPEDSIIYSGGVAQNVIWNTDLKRKYPKLDVLPHSGDEGLSLGIIEWLRQKYDQPIGHIPNFPFAQNDETADFASDEIIEKTAKFLAEGKVVALYQGNGEIGPRALGNRSLLMSPLDPNGREKINKIKNREQYRPFGASVLEERADEFFDEWFVDKYMVYTAKPKQGYPAITHVDETCRVQTVGDENPTFHKLLQKFYEMTGCGVLLNTSLNVSGKPTCSRKSHAFSLFANIEFIDILVVGNEMYVMSS